MPEHRVFILRQHDDEWEALTETKPKGQELESFLPEGQVIARLRFREGALFESFHGTNWTRHARIINPYGIWWAKLLHK